MQVTLDFNTIVMLAGVIAAIGGVGAAVAAVVHWFDKQNKQDVDIKNIKKEQRVIVESLFAISDGLKQLGCNGEVTKAHDRLRDHLNAQAHEE